MIKYKLDEIADQTKPFPIVDGPFGTQLHASEYTESGVPVVRIANLSFAGQFLDKDLVFISPEKAEKIKRSEITEGDIIIAKTGATIGKTGMFPYKRGVIASSCMKISPDPRKVDREYLLFLLSSAQGQNKIIDGASGSTRTTINMAPFKQIQFDLPALKEQRYISRVLGRLNKVIQQTESLLAKYQRIKTGLMQDLFTKGIDEHGNIRSEQTHEFKDSALGRIPVEWEVKQTQDISILVTKGESPGWQGFEYQTEGVLFVTSENVREGFIDINSNRKFIPELFHNQLIRSQLKKDDILINLVGASIARSAIFDEEIEANINQAVSLIRLKNDEVTSSWFSLYLQHSESIQRLLGDQVETARANLSLSDIRNFEIAKPPLIEQTRISDRINSITNSFNKLNTSLNKLHRIKTGLMQDLLTGKVRVTELMKKTEFVSSEHVIT